MQEAERSKDRPWRRLDAGAKAAVVLGLMDGARVVDLAAGLGVTAQAFRNARKRDPLFDAGWRAAQAASAEAERRAARERRILRSGAVGAGEALGGGEAGRAGAALGLGEGVDACEDMAGEERIVCNNRRLFQRRRMRHVRFDVRRRGVFLAHFAWSCDLLAAAAEAGVCERTVYVHLRTDAEFHALFQAALEQGYAWLEAEAVRQRLAVQQRLRAALEASAPAADADAASSCAGTEAELAGEFERVMKLLTRWDRRQGGAPAIRRHRPSAEQAWTFEEAITALEKRLKAVGLLRKGDGTSAKGAADAP
ncbi:MAG TPA: hypothetical protein VGC56_15435 [Allosphingosinicella sp.]|jgi:hypothetical protein